MGDAILKNKKIHQATLLAYKGNQKVAELSKGSMTSDSSFAIVSISKLYTHAMAFRLIDKKLLTKTHYYKLNEESIVPIYNGDYTSDWQKYLSTQMAQGGIVSTNNELMQFLQAFFRGKLFSEKHIANPVFRRIQFIPLKYGSGMIQLKIPPIFSPCLPAPEIIGHSGASGSFAFYCPSKDVFITGTINQIQHRPFEAIYRVIDKL